MKQMIITEYKQHMIACHYQDDRLCEIVSLDSDEFLHNIYVGKVSKVVPNIAAAFVDIAPGVTGFFPYNEETPIILNRQDATVPKVGDEMLVQVASDEIKSKKALLTSKLSITGLFTVTLSEKAGINLSKKLRGDAAMKEMAKALEDSLFKDRGMILRTNAKMAHMDQIQREYTANALLLNEIFEKARYQKPYTCLYESHTTILELVETMISTETEEIITDREDYYEFFSNTSNLLKTGNNASVVLKFYEEPYQSLADHYHLPKDIEKALNKNVWLRSGAYIVIEPTEAMTVIDVNTGKAVTGKDKEANILKINLEATAEIARQLRLRNLSGIIIIDYINMKDPKHKERVIKELSQKLAEDSITAAYVDMTKLGLVEVTRKKMHAPVHEWLK